MNESDKKALEAKLTRARQELLAMVEPFDQEEWQTLVYSEDQEWKVADVLRHLAGAESSMTRLSEIIRDGGEGVPEDFDLARWNKRGIQKASDKQPPEILVEMSQNRESLFKFIDSLTEEDWSKSGRHGSLRIMTIEQIVHLIADHELRHTSDIKQVLAIT